MDEFHPLLEHSPRSARTKRIVSALIERDGPACTYCSVAFSSEVQPTVDHRVPKSMGGTNSLRNFLLACAPCNMAKGSRTEEAFRRKPKIRRKRRPKS